MILILAAPLPQLHHLRLLHCSPLGTSNMTLFQTPFKGRLSFDMVVPQYQWNSLMLSHYSQGKENSRPNMVRALSVPPAPQQHDTPHLLLSAPAIPDGQTSLSSLSSPSSLSQQAFALSLPRSFYPRSLGDHQSSPPQESPPHFPGQARSSSITRFHGTLYFSRVAAAVSRGLCALM